MKITFLGDLCTNEYDVSALGNFKKTKVYEHLDKNSGFVVGNLEAPLLKEFIHENNNKACFINKTEFVEFYNFVNVFNLANNHIMDQGHDGLYSTISNIEQLSKMYLGAGENISEARRPLVITLDGYKICLLAYCCYSSNSECYAKKSSPGPAPLVFEYMSEDIAEARKLADFVIVLPHWGIEHEFHPTYDQVIYARKAVDLGADAVIGSHSHTLQSYEYYKNKPIYYSLGNFLMRDFFLSKNDKYYWSEFNKEGMFVELTIHNGKLVFNEMFYKFDDDFIPEFCDISKLKTHVEKNNNQLFEKTKDIQHDNYHANLNLTLTFNGKSMQIVNNSPLVSSSFKGDLISFKTKAKRLFMIMMRKFFN